MKPSIFLALLLATLSTALRAADKPNILFVAIDDQNDWIGHLGGHPMASAPPSPAAPNSANRVLTYDKTTDEAVREGKTVKRSDPIPE